MQEMREERVVREKEEQERIARANAEKEERDRKKSQDDHRHMSPDGDASDDHQGEEIEEPLNWQEEEFIPRYNDHSKAVGGLPGIAKGFRNNFAEAGVPIAALFFVESRGLAATVVN
ncbi:unnamed protein product [Cylicocyclus nassatus]|uniref:Uncharacterized protein n=1 Tax=Cylicocyclus nassatus TaxID=53992 RepID=A0AA36H7R2_CYLNA|nr:unnamed protein product [Cylicocyclus nassatus]